MAELTTSYLNFSLYPEHCILKTISLTFSTLLSHGNSLLQLRRTLTTSWVSTEVVNSALKAYERRKKADQEGERPSHRPREWKREERDQEKARKRSNWYKKGGNEVVIFVPAASPYSQLQRRYQKKIKRQGFKIKVVEKLSWCCD